MEGALTAIRCAREGRIPFLGTCGGFQHAIIEYARNVLGWQDAAHGELDSTSTVAVISLLSCPLINVGGSVQLVAGTRIAAAYGTDEATEVYFCSYGVNPDFRASLVAGPLREAARDDTGDLRAVELDDHPFFVATLFPAGACSAARPTRAARERVRRGLRGRVIRKTTPTPSPERACPKATLPPYERGRGCFSQVTSGFQSVSAPLRLSSNAQTWIS